MALGDTYVEVTAVGIQGLSGAVSAVGASGATGEVGASGLSGATGTQGASGAQGIAGASGLQGDQGASGVIGYTGATGAQGIAGASGVGLTGATGYTGATGIGVVGASGITYPTISYTTTSTNEELIDTINTTLYRSVKYEMQESYNTLHCVSEIRFLHDDEHAFLTQYAVIGDYLGTFASYYSPVVNNYSSPQINNGGVSYWNGTNLRVYTSNNTVIQALLSIIPGVIIDLNSGATSVTINTKFIELEAGIYEATTIETRSPILLLSNVSWTGTGTCELRYTANNVATELKFKKEQIEV